MIQKNQKIRGNKNVKKIKNNPKATAQLNQLIESQPDNNLIKKAAQSQLKVMEWEKEKEMGLIRRKIKGLFE